MEKKSLKIAFAGGGTGGHIYPGLAIADELRSLCKEKNIDIKIVWLGNSTGMDKNIVESSGSVDIFKGIPSGKLRRYFSLKNFSDIFKIFCGFAKSFSFLMRFKPDALFSKGGFVSVPPCVASRILRIPVLTHECDFTPGLATKINSRFASKILVSYEKTAEFLKENLRNKAIVTGNPIRPVFYNAKPERGKEFLFGGKEDFDEKKPILLVLGGSLGAAQINALVSENLDWLTSKFNVVHQRGKNAGEAQKKSGYFPYDFIYSEMPDVISCADIVLSRAGANSIWECAALGKPLVLIPLCGSGTRGDQVDNARFFEESGAAIVLLKDDANSKELQKSLVSLEDLQNRKKMAESSKKLADSVCKNGVRPAGLIAQILFETAQNGGAK